MGKERNAPENKNPSSRVSAVPKFLTWVHSLSEHPAAKGLQSVVAIIVTLGSIAFTALLWYHNNEIARVNAERDATKDQLTGKQLELADARARTQLLDARLIDLSDRNRKLESEVKRLEGLQSTVEGLNTQLGIESSMRMQLQEDKWKLATGAAEAKARLELQHGQLTDVTAKADSLQTELNYQLREAARRLVSSPSLEAQQLWELGKPSPKAIEIITKVDEVLSSDLLSLTNAPSNSPEQVRAYVALAASTFKEIQDQRLDGCDFLEPDTFVGLGPILLFHRQGESSLCLERQARLQASLWTRASAINSDMPSVEEQNRIDIERQQTTQTSAGY